MKKLVFTYLSILFVSLTMVNCSSKDSNNNPVVNQNGICGVGQVNTQLGCLAQGICPAGYGAANGQCYPQIASNLGTNGMVNTPMGSMTVIQCQQYYGQYSTICTSTTYNNGYYNQYNQYNNGYYNTGMVCPIGQVNTNIGCLPQNSCPADYGYYNNYCYPAMQQNNWSTGPGRCVYKSFYWYCTSW